MCSWHSKNHWSSQGLCGPCGERQVEKTEKKKKKRSSFFSFFFFLLFLFFLLSFRIQSSEMKRTLRSAAVQSTPETHSEESEVESGPPAKKQRAARAAPKPAATEDDGVKRCTWVKSDLDKKYHDHEWGIPSRDDKHLFEMIVLEGFQGEFTLFFLSFLSFLLFQVHIHSEPPLTARS